MTSIHAHFDEEHNTVVYTLKGPAITAEQLVTGYEKILDDPRMKKNMHSIWDVSGLDLRKIPVAEVRALPRTMHKLMERRGTNFKVALVTRRSVDHQLLKMYVTILRLIGNFRFRLFSSNKEAEAWVREKHNE
jgi:hypothetical protein